MDEDLRSLQRELAEAEVSPWEPRCVAGAFQRLAPERFVLTMQAWIDLEAVRSPFLLGQMPVADAAMDAFSVALAAFGYRETTPEQCEPEELLVLGGAMVRAVGRAFAMGVRMMPPGGWGDGATQPHGMGRWLPLLACLVGQMHMRPQDALALPVGQVLALVAAHRANEGWTVAGEPYALRSTGVSEEGDDGGR